MLQYIMKVYNTVTVPDIYIRVLSHGLTHLSTLRFAVEWNKSHSTLDRQKYIYNN